MTAVYISIFSLLFFVGLSGIWLWKRSYKPQQDSLLIGAWSAAFGTLVLGFLVALLVYYIQSERQNAANESQAVATKERLISIFNSELTDDLQAIELRIAARNQTDKINAIYKSPLKFDFWRIISNSGDMKVLKDLEVVYALSQAYANIAYTESWERRLLDVLNSASIATNVGKPDGSQIPLALSVLDNVVTTYEPTKQAIVKAIGAFKRPAK